MSTQAVGRSGVMVDKKRYENGSGMKTVRYICRTKFNENINVNHENYQQ